MTKMRYVSSIKETMISSQVTKNSYTTNGVTKDWAYTFPIEVASDIAVYQTNATGLTSRVTSNFTVDTVNAVVNYPSVASLLPAIANADYPTITIARATPLTQPTQYTSQGAVSKESLETALDHVVLMIQDLNETVGRCVKYSIDKAPVEADLTHAASLAEHFSEGNIGDRPATLPTWGFYYAWDDDGGQLYLYSPAKGWSAQ